MNEQLWHGIQDCVVIGGGPAGLTAAIFLGRYRRKVLVIDSGKPRNAASRGIHGFLGWDGVEPAELLRRGRKQALDSGATVVESVVDSVACDGDSFIICMGNTEIRSRRIVLAYGVRDVLPEIEGFDQTYGRGVYHCPDCDGYEVRDMNVGILGSGAGAAHVALRLRLWTDKLTIITGGGALDANDELISKLEASEIRRLEKGIVRILAGPPDRIDGVVLDDGENLALDALFFAIGCNRSSELAEMLGCEISEGTSDLVVDERLETSVKGVYAVGDLTPGSKLAIRAAASGAVAAIAINESLTAPGESSN